MRARAHAHIGRHTVSWHAKCTVHLLISSTNSAHSAMMMTKLTERR